MAKDPLFPKTPGEDDSWESLAGDLFGIDFDAETESEEILSPEELAEDLDESLTDDVEKSSPEEADETDSKSDVLLAESPDEDDSEPEEEIPPASIMHDDEEDSFWDPLESWNWDDDEEDATAQPSAEKRKKPITKKHPKPSKTSRKKNATSGKATPQPSSSQVDSEEFIEDSDFAAGILDSSSPALDTGEADHEDEKSTPEKPPAKRRRRRKKKRTPSETVGEQPADNDSTHEELHATEIDEGIKITAQSETEEGDTEVEQGRGKRPSRRRSRRRRKPETVKEPQATDEDTVEETDDSKEGPKSKDKSEKSTYRNIPTWEEAISCLLNPQSASSKNPETKGKETSGSTTSKREAGKSTRRRGRRRSSKS
ncbi:MAG: hypothetical protein Tsb009_13940 [Planctomycetaceae bacterium]